VCWGRRGLLWELSREREREKKDGRDIVVWFVCCAYGDLFEDARIALAIARIGFGRAYSWCCERGCECLE
jgi:hypothetical protein